MKSSWPRRPSSWGLLLSQGDKKSTLVKHHKAYRLVPDNAQPALALLAEA